MAPDDLCIRCRQAREDVLHVLLDCRKANEIWEFLIAPTEFLDFKNTNKVDWFRHNLKKKFNNIVLPNCPWLILFVTTLWSIWKGRNLAVFQNRIEPLRITINRARDLAIEILESYNPKFETKDKIRQIVNWSKPPESWIKLNTDGSVIQNGNSAAAGGLLRDHNGSWITGFSMKIGKNTITVAELIGLREGLRMAWERRIEKLSIKIDSEVVLQMIKSATTNSHPLGRLIEDCRFLLHRPWTTVINHTRRKGNGCADVLAKKGHKLDTPFLEWKEPPREVM